MASLAAKAVLAVAVLLSGTLLLQAAQAQQQRQPPNSFTVKLSETLAAGDAPSKDVKKFVSKSISTKVSISDSIRKNLVHPKQHLYQSIFEQVSVNDKVKGPSVVSITESLRIRERPLLSGAIVPPAPPQLSVPEGQKTFHSDRDDSVTISFQSSSAGTYKIDIENAAGDTVATFAGAMAQGDNQVKWTGVDSQGKAAPSGTYTYYITARNDSGTRSAPGGGDGKIVVDGADAAGAPAAPGRLDLVQIPFMELLPVALPVVVAGGAAAAFLVSKKRKKKLVLYLPPDAAPVIEDIRQKYPGATVEDYMSPGEQGSSRYVGVIIDSKESNDEWLSGIIAKAKQLAGVDSISLSYRGKMRSV